MIPISDADTIRTGRPVVNIGLITISTLVFLYEFFLPNVDQVTFFYKYGVIAAELTEGIEFKILGSPLGLDISSPIPTWGTVFTSMFIHGGFVHLIGNMMFLWVFGDNIEHRLGHVKYLLFYLGAGLAATWAQIGVDMDSQTPLVGASGAISGVIGAYLLTYPYNRVTTLVIFVFITVVRVPALYLLGFWFVLQLFNGLGSLGPAASGAGVAYMAHVGGFVAGMLFMAGYKLVSGERVWPYNPWPGRSWNPWQR